MATEYIEKSVIDSKKRILESGLHRYLPAFQNLGLFQIACSVGPLPSQSSTPDIYHALTSNYPLVRYLPGDAIGMPVRLQMFVVQHLPERISDWYVNGPLYTVIRFKYSELLQQKYGY